MYCNSRLHARQAEGIAGSAPATQHDSGSSFDRQGCCTVPGEQLASDGRRGCQLASDGRRGCGRGTARAFALCMYHAGRISYTLFFMEQECAASRPRSRMQDVGASGTMGNSMTGPEDAGQDAYYRCVAGSCAAVAGRAVGEETGGAGHPG